MAKKCVVLVVAAFRCVWQANDDGAVGDGEDAPLSF